jgi:cytochrome c-type protein NapC
MNNKTSAKSRLCRLLGFLRKPSAKYSLLTLLVVGFISGILFWAGFNTALENTNTQEFCVGCHEMNDMVFEEYKTTIHYNNSSGVRATCPDCHVPKDFRRKMMRKAVASLELWHSFVGTIDTKEKFEARRMAMATREWNRFKESNSANCRTCHDFNAMMLSKQKPRARKEHAQALIDGKSCIDCHKGIAHLLPKEYKDPNEE